MKVCSLTGFNCTSDDEDCFNCHVWQKVVRDGKDIDEV